MIIADTTSRVLTSASDPLTSFNHTVGSAYGNRILLVGYFVDNVSDVVVGVTYNGVALTKLDALDRSTNCRVEVWYLVNPDTGTNAISIDRTSTNIAGAYAMSFYGVDQTNPFGLVTKSDAAASSNPWQYTVLSSIPNSWLVSFTNFDQTGAASTPTGEMVEWIQDSPNTAKTGWLNTITTTGVTTGTFKFDTTPFTAPYAAITAELTPDNAGGINSVLSNNLRPAIFTPGLAK